jgi:hypothetical protein
MRKRTNDGATKHKPLPKPKPEYAEFEDADNEIDIPVGDDDFLTKQWGGGGKISDQSDRRRDWEIENSWS